MAPKNDTATVETEVSEAAAATRAEIGNRPRQSVVRYVEHYVTIRETNPDRLEELFGDQIEALEAVADKVRNPVQEAIEKAASSQAELSLKALENDDPLNGYASYIFDQETFDEKTREKKPRTVKSKVEKAKDLLADASEDDLKALAELFAARGIEA